jgi:hypothetical protein
MDILGNIKSMLSDGVNGSVSSKRVVTILAFVLCATGFIANLFWGFKIDQFIYDSMMYIVIGGLGFTGLEKFAPKSPQ